MPHTSESRDLLLEFSNPGQILEGLDERHGAIFVPWIIPGLSAGDRVGVTLAFKNREERFDLRATVRWVRAQGTGMLPAGVALDVHRDDILKLRKVAHWGRGEEVQYFKRQHPRFPCDIPCTVAHGSAEADARLLDISESGAFVSLRGSELPSIGAEVELRTRARTSLCGPRIKIPAKVMWLDFFEDSRGFGVRFAEEPSDKILKLVERVRQGLKTA